MPTTTTNRQLNELLVDLHRSLVQYVLDAWLWSTEDAKELKGVVLSLAERQRQDAGTIAMLLMSRHYVIDFGNYPTDFTRLNYVAIEFLYENLCAHQNMIVQSLAEALPQLKSDPAAHDLINDILSSQKVGLERLLNSQEHNGTALPAWMK
ncbi:hypothetical protein [Planctomicrobium sp. SH527]|uniref:hypothetical protein n=1 Tax=Planctomicrobium sp. SH527 TaxID=3448123 RepID=UPI003F5B33A6